MSGGVGEVLYDDPGFFARYQRMRADRAGLNEDLEQPALARMLPDVSGLDVLDLGCGDGTLTRRLAAAGARSVLGVDASTRMLALARARPAPRVRYLHDRAERLALPSAALDLVVSSLVLHYLADYPGLIQRVSDWLRPGGQLVFSVEHPVCTAQNPMTGWHTTGGGTVWPLDGYAQETARRQEWFGTPVTKYHRRLTTLLGGIADSGLVVTGIDEPYPDDEVLAKRPEFAEHLRRPPLLLISAHKSAG
ncbi:class I SAM-dependent methyltransferase [Kitasatospora sp. NPDC052896]|uniref:class I SAM-dependent methyltransferase n=1 Tax=Kitasatospora sp. NPDC052896 TaxID=3364061 RepID=UPI0037CC3E84